MTPRIGSLFSGYGGLDMAVQAVYGGEVVWYSEIEPAACKVMAAHHPEVLNIGDITQYGDCQCAIPFDHLPRIDVLTGGYPCQPFSTAGKRKGTDDQRHMYPYVSAAISAVEPSLVVLENVRGHLSMGLADVIGDLARLGYDARWGVVRASDAGAPHGRARVFIVAHAAGDGHRWRHDAAGPDGLRVQGVWTGPAGCGVSAANTSDDGRSGKRSARGWSHGLTDGRAGTDWGRYAPAIGRWERILGRPAPAPTVTRPNGKQRLAPVFVEWLMGLPAGYVTEQDIPYTAQLKMLGNGVVPQQAELALRMLAAADA